MVFHQAVEKMDVWSASSADILFVITFASPTGPGFHGRRGFLASWRPIYSSAGAVKLTGSPFNTFADAEATGAGMLTSADLGCLLHLAGRMERAGKTMVGAARFGEEYSTTSRRLPSTITDVWCACGSSRVISTPA